jgi:hypothetical protein
VAVREEEAAAVAVREEAAVAVREEGPAPVAVREEGPAPVAVREEEAAVVVRGAAGPQAGLVEPRVAAPPEAWWVAALPEP